MAASSDCRRCCPTSSESLVLGKTPLPAQPSVSLSVNPCWQMQGMFQPRALDGAFLYPCLFSLTDTAAPALPAHPQGPGLSQGMLRWLSESWHPQVWECAAPALCQERLCSCPTFLTISPHCWAWPCWVLQHLQQLRRTSCHHQCTVMVLLAQTALASMAIKQLWDFLGTMRIFFPH